jgi:PHD/YefM family antitoxin component YafN of YafNO toxin-antitoxin module
MATAKQGQTGTGEGTGTETDTSGFSEDQRKELAGLIADGLKAHSEGGKPVRVTKEGKEGAGDDRFMSVREMEARQEEITREAVRKIRDEEAAEKLKADVSDLKNGKTETVKPQKQVSALYRFLFGDPPE